MEVTKELINGPLKDRESQENSNTVDNANSAYTQPQAQELQRDLTNMQIISQFDINNQGVSHAPSNNMAGWTHQSDIVQE